MNGLLAQNILSNFALSGIISSKKSATGTAISASSYSTFTHIDGTNGQSYPINVSGLDFKPSLILLICDNNSITVYSELNDGYPKTVKTCQISNGYTTGNTHNYKGDVASASVTIGSFTLPCQNSNGNFKWIAYE